MHARAPPPLEARPRELGDGLGHRKAVVLILRLIFFIQIRLVLLPADTIV